MYESYTRQSLPTREYRELLGAALCVFNSNVGFIIENILRLSESSNWYELMDKEAGRLKKDVANIISKKTGNNEIEVLFCEIIGMRNRIIHSFRITSKTGEQSLATKTKIQEGNSQWQILVSSATPPVSV